MDSPPARKEQTSREIRIFRLSYVPWATGSTRTLSHCRLLYTFGNEGVGIIRGPRWINSDFSVQRNFALTEHTRLQVRAELFNAFNHTNLNGPRPILGMSFGVINSSGPARQIQAGARLEF
jgi:hypothetical protein